MQQMERPKSSRDNLNPGKCGSGGGGVIGLSRRQGLASLLNRFALLGYGLSTFN